MTLAVACGVVAAVYRTPLPVVLDMPLSQVVAFYRLTRRVLPMVEPLAGSEPEPIRSAEQAAALFGVFA